uniref:Uncharacterized protein n=1 Tax=uncultured bacterium Contig99 TaxID=1393639 RepID=W0FN67_9BACT|nr:hypothetical protein [uncultured bacterium Contig99]
MAHERTMILCALVALALICGAAAEPDPAAGLLGVWACDDALLTVASGEDGLTVYILRDDSVTERVEWFYPGAAYDEESGGLRCSANGVELRTAYGPGGEEGVAEQVYADGSAVFARDGGDGLVWTDLREEPAVETAFARALPIPEAFEGAWVAQDGSILYIVPVGERALCLLWNRDFTVRWLYSAAVYSPAENALVTLAVGAKTRIEIDGETGAYKTYEHEYTGGRAVFALEGADRLLWTENAAGGGDAVAFDRFEAEQPAG